MEGTKEETFNSLFSASFGGHSIHNSPQKVETSSGSTTNLFL